MNSDHYGDSKEYRERYGVQEPSYINRPCPLCRRHSEASLPSPRKGNDDVSMKTLSGKVMDSRQKEPVHHCTPGRWTMIFTGMVVRVVVVVVLVMAVHYFQDEDSCDYRFYYWHDHHRCYGCRFWHLDSFSPPPPPPPRPSPNNIRADMVVMEALRWRWLWWRRRWQSSCWKEGISMDEK